MYKVMIVDDEWAIREGIKNIIDWKSINISSVEIAENGQDALFKFIENPVDIIITDINMPIIDGIELLKNIKEEDSNTRFIIISGYEDFNYAKEAISIGVQAYILKPIDEDELTNNLVAIVDELEKENNYSENKLCLFKDVLTGVASDEEIRRAEILFNNSRYNNKESNNDDNVYVASILFVNDSKGTKTIKSIKNMKNLKDKKDKSLNNSKFYIENFASEVIRDNFENIIMIDKFNKNITYLELKQYYQKLLDEIIEKCNIDVFIGIGTIVNTFKELNNSYKISYMVKKSVLQEGFNKCITIEEANTTTIDFTNEVNRVNRLIFENGIENIYKITDYIQEVFSHHTENLQCIYDFAIKILILCDDLRCDIKNYSEDILNIENENIWILGEAIIKVLNFTELSSIKNYLENKILNAIINRENETNKLSPVIKRVVRHINKNYVEDISLKNLALEYNMNTSYLGQLFTKELGMQFSEYINKVRSTVAKELILKTNKKIHDISKEVGYVDTSYFYRNFKKYYGVTPATLRELQK